MRSLEVSQNSIKASENGSFLNLRQESWSPASCDFKRASVRGDFFWVGLLQLAPGVPGFLHSKAAALPFPPPLEAGVWKESCVQLRNEPPLLALYTGGQ